MASQRGGLIRLAFVHSLPETWLVVPVGSMGLRIEGGRFRDASLTAAYRPATETPTDYRAKKISPLFSKGSILLMVR